MVVDVLAPARHRPETLREQNLRIELTTLTREVVAYCDRIKPRLDALEPAAIELGPLAHQLVAGALHDVAALRRKVEA